MDFTRSGEEGGFSLSPPARGILESGGDRAFFLAWTGRPNYEDLSRGTRALYPRVTSKALERHFLQSTFRSNVVGQSNTPVQFDGKKDAVALDDKFGGGSTTAGTKVSSSPNAARRRSASPAPKGSSGGRNRNPILLVVEPKPDQFILLKRALWKAGATARVWWAHSTAEALTILPEVETEGARICIVSRGCASDEKAIELLKTIKSRSTPAQVSFAFLTSVQNDAFSNLAYASGADAIFTWERTPERLLNLARELQRFAVQGTVELNR